VGWISDRHMKNGGSLYSGGPKRKGPLRKIVKTLRVGTTIFESDRVELECGHEGRSWGGEKAICTQCRKDAEEKK
jgi:hypothetical protein